MIFPPHPKFDSKGLEELPPALALEVDALCDEFERHWRRARQPGSPLPRLDTFLQRASTAIRPILAHYLSELERDLRSGNSLQQVPGFLVEEEIGRGGMGVVYRARRLEDGRTVALKLIPGAEHARWSRWLPELVDLRHPNLVPLESFGTHDGLYFVVMPFVPGGDLKERIGEFFGPLDEPATLRKVAGLMAKVAGAVAFLHRCGILHRDLKPSNILLSSAEDPEPLVCDFGLAGRLDEVSPESLRVVGTPSYMAPEQMEGQPLTPAADIWGLGAVLHELLTGWPPSRLEAWRKQASEPVLPEGLAANTLERICLRCLAREARNRYPTAAELVDDLEHYLHETADTSERVS